MQVKGHRSIKISWVKGHAKQCHIDSGVTTFRDMVGNDQADATADEATALYGKDLLNVASWFHDRAKAYVSFMKKVSHHIVEAYIIHRQLLDEQQSDQQATDRGTFYQPLRYPELSCCRKIKHCASTGNYSKFLHDNPGAGRVEAFLKGLDVSPTTGGQRPVSWVELYVLFVCRGYEVFEVPVHLAYEQPSADKRVRAFKSMCRAVVGRTLPDRGDAELFSAAKQVRDDLGGVGIVGQNASVMFNVHVSDHEKHIVARALVNLSRKVSVRSVDDYLDVKRKLVPRVLTLNGNSGWVSTIDCSSPNNSVDDLWTLAPLTVDAEAAKNVAFYKCKHCDRVEPSSCANFLYSDLDRAVRCRSRNCLKLTRSREWKCACEVVWFTCAKHAKHVACGSLPAQSHEQATGRSVSSESSCNKKAPKESATDFQSLLQDDLKRGRKRPNADFAITLGDSAMPPQRLPKLGAILSKRFGSSSSTSY